MSHHECLVDGYTTRQVGDAEYRCNRCDGDQGAMERAEEGLIFAALACRRARWAEQHRDDCEFCAYVGAGGPVCRYDRAPLLDDQERSWGICEGCYADGVAEMSAQA